MEDRTMRDKCLKVEYGADNNELRENKRSWVLDVQPKRVLEHNERLVYNGKDSTSINKTK